MAVTEEQFVGRISIHHELNDALRVEGGHIGYDTVPSFEAEESLRRCCVRLCQWLARSG